MRLEGVSSFNRDTETTGDGMKVRAFPFRQKHIQDSLFELVLHVHCSATVAFFSFLFFFSKRVCSTLMQFLALFIFTASQKQNKYMRTL